MAKEEFDIGKWFNPDGGAHNQPLSGEDAPIKAPQELRDNVETVTGRIEQQCLDITGDYGSWRDIGFALADGLGEAGRTYFHRVSKFYPKYNAKEADKQFTQCLKGKKSGITIRTFFHKAKEAGIDIRMRSSATYAGSAACVNGGTAHSASAAEVANLRNLRNPDQLPTFTEEIEAQLPEFLQKITTNGSTEQEKDVLLLGAITTLSACLPNISGLYDRVEVFPNLFFFLTARASSGKGRLNLCRLLVESIHERLFEIYELQKEEYEMKLKEYNSRKTPGIPKPDPPIKNMLFIPANSSATSVYQILGESHERGLIFETEGDTLAQSFTSDFGNYSDGFRKAFHHEAISYHRRKDDEHVDIKHPQLSAVLSGTPEQLRSLVRDAENGLFSRFIYYRLNSGLEWKNVFANPTGESLNQTFEDLGAIFAEFHEQLEQAPALRFRLSDTQEEKFNEYFKRQQEQLYKQYGDEIIASVRRMGLIFFRITMVLSALRMMETGDLYGDLVCADLDFDSAMVIVKAITQHTIDVYMEVCTTSDILAQDKNTTRKRFYEELPVEFDRRGYIRTATALSIPSRTAERYVNQLCQTGALYRPAYGLYAKPIQSDPPLTDPA